MKAEAAVAELGRADPAFALGIGELSGALPPGRASFPLERLAVLNDIAAKAEGDPVDVEHFKHCVAAESFALVELGERLKNPDVLTPLCDWGMTLLFAPFSYEAERDEALARFAAEIPIYLAEAATTLSEPDALWRDIALEVAAGVPALLRAIANGRPGVEKHAAKASAGLADFVRALRALRGREGARLLDRDTYQKLLQLKGIPYDLRELEELGEERIAHLREKREKLSKALTGYTDAKNARRAVEADGPATFAELRQTARAARELCGERAIAPIPSDEELIVVETPAFARPLIPFAAIMVPKPRWPVQRSVYYVTRGGSRAEMRNTVVHEAYPGHHLQFSYANQRGSLWRNAPWTSAQHAQMGVDTIEGWAHYCEAMMMGQGFHDTPADRFQVCHDSLWRAHRILLDIALSTGTMSVEAAAQRLVDEVGMPADAALSEARRYTLMPGYNLCYAVGKHMIRELRVEAERRWQRGYSLERFHALIMDHGFAPLSLVRKRL